MLLSRSPVRSVLLGASICLLATAPDSPAQTASGNASAEMQRVLDNAFKPGLLETRAPRKNADGSYSKIVSTGDLISKDTISTPLKAVRAACLSSEDLAHFAA